MFTGLGVGAALSGKAFGSILGSPWVVAFLAVLLTAFAISMFGAFEMNLPPSLAARLNTVGGEGYGGAFLMGLVAGVVAAPCTGPVLSGVLLHVARTQDVPLGAGLLFTYALGIGLPFFLIGAFSLSLPKSGPWMDSVKSVFGIALLTLAVSYVRDALPVLKGLLSLQAVASGAVVAGLLVAVGIAIGAVHRSFHEWPREGASKALGVLVVVAGLVLRAGAPLGAPVSPAKELAWGASVEKALEEGALRARPVLIDFYADWCPACKELDQLVYPHPSFVKEAEEGRFVLVKIDGTNEPPEVEALYKKYGIRGLPTVIFIDGKGGVRGDLTVTGFVEPADFVQRMRRIHEPG
jgi:thiol:disulfide interchange protein DsbD